MTETTVAFNDELIAAHIKKTKDSITALQRSIDSLYRLNTEHSENLSRLTGRVNALSERIEIIDTDKAVNRMQDMGKLFDGVYTRYTVVTELIHYAVANGEMDNDTRLAIVRGAMLLLDSDERFWKANHDKSLGDLVNYILRAAKKREEAACR